MGTRYLLSFFVFSTLLFWFISSSHTLADAAAAAKFTSQKVTLSLYYESLCPYCANFIVNKLVNVFNTDLYTIVNLKMVPWGNAKIQGTNHTITCQHGENECYLNTIHACAIDAWPVGKHFKFIRCLETQAPKIQDTEAVWRQCSDDLGLSQEPIDDCYNSGRGKQLILEYADETDALHPQHKFVPWVVVNGRALEGDYENYAAYVCKAYKGNNVPHACSSYSQMSTVKETSNNSGCYAEAKKVPKMEPPA
ncbi:hypothetical protein Pint_34932 [Pistacia integerrima]|uniref:Uncharacterized protein n=1 Tax=Pistacia integerrima TaxID=434235 RepID=A0ACC0Y1I8_9ROSI|nr:hypothetical protein Pint_34932 [Pistacia integerrima]